MSPQSPERTVYLDNNATTAVAPEVRDAMMPYLRDLYGNPSSMHTFGGQVRKAVETARGQVASLLGCDASEIIFTSCGSESDNQGIRGALEALGGPGQHVVTSRVEHPAVLSQCQHLERLGHRVTRLPVDAAGELVPEDLDKALADKPALVSLMWANNETGVLFPAEELARRAKAAGALFHTDAVQAVGKIPINLKKTAIDLLSLSGHKLHAPKGIGALVVRKGTPLNPLIWGGHQEWGKRAGTENVPYIVGLGRACELAAAKMDEENGRVRALRDRLEAGLLSTCADARRNGHAERRLPNTTNISFEFIEGEAILLLLDEHGICASSGSACTSGSLEPSHVMRAMGVPFTAAHGSIRFSLSVYSTDADVDLVLAKMPGIVDRLRELSPFVAK